MPKTLMSRRVIRAVGLGVICLMLLIARADMSTIFGLVQINNSGPNAMSAAYMHTATLLQDGRVLMTGGASNAGYVKASYLFDPAINAFTKTGDLGPNGRSNHTATLLPNGNVLVAGGLDNSGILATTRIFQPATGTFVAGPNMPNDRAFHTATSLVNGDVVLAGGFSNVGSTNAVSIYHWTTNTFTTATMSVPRYFHVAALLGDGRVFIQGGFDDSGLLSSAEIYDPASNLFTMVANAPTVRGFHTAVYVPLADRVIVAGGASPFSGSQNSVEIYEPATDSWLPAPNLLVGVQGNTATHIGDGKVMFIAGLADTGYAGATQIYDFSTNLMTAGPNLAVPRYFHTATRLNSGNVLVSGGFGDLGPLNNEELYLFSPRTPVNLGAAVTPLVSVYGGTVDAAACVTVAGNGLAGKTLRLNLGGVDLGTATTDASGCAHISAQLSSTFTVSGTLRFLTASFPDDGSHLGATTVSGFGVTTKATPTITVTGLGTFTFDGQPHAASAAVTGAYGESLGAAAVTYTNQANNSVSSVPPTALGNYTVKASFAANANYVAATTTAGTITIAPADTTSPVITANDITAEATSPAGAAVTLVFSATDDTDPNPVVTADHASGTFPLGSTGVIVTATDAAGNSNTQTFVVHVVDTTAPTIAAPADQTLEATSAAGATVDPGTATGSDLAGAVTISGGGVAGDYPLGTTTLTWVATDQAGHTASAVQHITVVDTTAPTIAAPANQTVEATSAAGATVNPGTATGSDVAGTVTISGGGVTGNYPLGTTTLTWVATDQAGHTASAVQHITVVDTTAPTIAAPANQTVEATSAAGATVNPGTATGSDVAGTVTISGGGVTGKYPLGTTTLTWIATDQAGHTTSAVQHIVVVDTTPPSLSLPANISVNASSSSGAVVTFTASATDLVGGSIDVLCTPPSNSTFPVGTTTVSCSATDASNNQATGSFTVEVTASASTPVTLTNTLLATIQNMNLQQSAANSLTSKLNGVLSKLNGGNSSAACGQLGAFMNEVSAQSGKKLTAAQANQLTAMAQQIRAAGGC